MKKISVICDYCGRAISGAQAPKPVYCEKLFTHTCKSVNSNKTYKVEISISPIPEMHHAPPPGSLGDFHQDCFNDLCEEILREVSFKPRIIQ